MSRHARIEDVSDSDPEDMDIALFDPRNAAAAAAAAPPPYAQSTHTPGRPFTAGQSTFPSSSTFPQGTTTTTTNPSHLPTSSDPSTQYVNAGSANAYKSFQCLYPVYFDSTRPRSHGRRVPRTLATQNPLARTLVDACAALHLKTVFEPGKTHPRDWANPGRVRVLLKEEGEPAHKSIVNKYMLYVAVAEYLKAHPTRREDVLKLRLPGMPFDGKVPEEPAVPRGWRVGAVLPLHSAALSGGGVSDDIFKEMMKDMGMPGIEGAEKEQGQVVKKEKKEKKKGKR